MIRLAHAGDAAAVHAICAPIVRDTAISFEWEATVPNTGSERLHESMGFRPIGRFPNAGYKFDRWHDVAFWYLPLRPLPAQPHDLLPISQVLGTQEWNDALQA